MSEEFVLALYVGGLVVAGLIVAIAIVQAGRMISEAIIQSTRWEIQAFSGVENVEELFSGTRTPPKVS